MTSTSFVNQATFQAVTSAAQGLTANPFDLIALVLLILILVEQLLIQAYGSARSEEWRSTLNIGVLPLLMVFALNVGLAFARFLNLL